MTQQLNVEAMDEDVDLMQPMADEDSKGRDMAVGDEQDISGDGGVVKKLVQAGSGWELPQKDDKVFMHYTGRLTDGTKFDSSVDRGDPFAFTLGQGQVIKGWDRVVATMKKGEKVEATLSAEYAYGASGSPPTIPPGATLVFEMELLRWESVNDLSPEKDGSLMKSVLREGDLNVWDKPKEADLVTVSYSARVDGQDKAFVEASDTEFRVADGCLCPAVKAAVVEMKKGEQVELKAQPKWAFGDDGREGCPPGATVVITLSLDNVKTVKFVDPDHDGGLVKTIVHDGAAYHTPNSFATVTVSWTGTLADGTKFDEMSESELKMADDPFPCEALELAIASMRNGEEADVEVRDPKYAFGSEGLPGIVPPNEVVKYHITLHDFKDGPHNYELDGSAKVERAEHLKARGNKAFKTGALWKASRMYTDAESITSLTDDITADEATRLKDIGTSTNLNLAAIALREGNDKKCIALCNKVLEKQPDNVKALFRRSTARTNAGDLIEAAQDLDNALIQEPKNAELMRARKKLKQLRKQADKKDSKLYGQMFAKVGSMYKDEPDVVVAADASGGQAAELETAAPTEDANMEPLLEGETAA